ncbi:hypothetical protein DE146DRAFT_277895 [Phaeosphaeria sp. MPI-PUGE-AT-0046c]|nr:hypothetical protein DE146DRAFT_277895 [Phaeosphaeria sp. MPI-PUGE-AT-0046c]
MQIKSVFTQALRSVWIVFAVLAAVGLVLTWVEKEYEMQETLNSAYGLTKAKIMSASVEISRTTNPCPKRSGGGCVMSPVTE